MVEGRQWSRLSYGLVPVGDKGGEAVVEDGDSFVRVSGDESELHGSGNEWGSGGVEVVDGNSGDSELRLLRPVD